MSKKIKNFDSNVEVSNMYKFFEIVDVNDLAGYPFDDRDCLALKVALVRVFLGDSELTHQSRIKTICPSCSQITHRMVKNLDARCTRCGIRSISGPSGDIIYSTLGIVSKDGNNHIMYEEGCAIALILHQRDVDAKAAAEAAADEVAEERAHVAAALEASYVHQALEASLARRKIARARPVFDLFCPS